MKRNFQDLAVRIVFYILGSAIIAFGCSIYLLSDTGNDCFNVFMQGLAKTLHISYSASHIGINVVILIFLLMFGRSYIKMGTFVSLFIMGPVTDLTVFLLGDFFTANLPYLHRLFIASFSLPVTAFGLAAIMTADIGIGPNDVLSVFLSDKLKVNFRWVRICVDVSWVILGVLLGGVAGVMTIAAAFLVGPIASFFFEPQKKLLARLGGKRDQSAFVSRISPGDGHYFYGYYDLSPLSSDGKYHLMHHTAFADRLQVKGDLCEIGMVNMENGQYQKIGKTAAWNFQQGAMLQWNPANPDKEIIYNDVRDGSYVGVVRNVETGSERILVKPVANVSRDGRYALSINFSRMYDFRPGYGYAYESDPFASENHSAGDGVFLIDMESGKARLILSLQEIWDFTGDYFDGDRKLVINHITFNPSASRFVLLVRNFRTDDKPHKTAVITADRDGKNLFLLSDYGCFSHYWWMDDTRLAAYCDGKELSDNTGIANYILVDQSYSGSLMSRTHFREDNHMSLSPTGRYLLNDTYPDSQRLQKLCVYDREEDCNRVLGKFYSPEVPVVDIRCDLHPRFTGDGKWITFDSTHEGFRGVYAVKADKFR